MKRIVFINGHCNDLLMTTMCFYLLKMKVPCKYITLLKELTEREDLEFINLVTKDGIYVKPEYVHIPFAWALAKWESKYVLKKNGLSDRIKTITDVNEIHRDDVILHFLHTRRGSYDLVKKIDAYKILQINQYYCYSREYLSRVLPDYNAFALEANVFEKDNYIMNAKLPVSYKMTIVPFVVGDRFVNKTPFEQRKNKAIAMGTIGPCNNPDYVEFYGTNLIHKMRQVIYDHKDEIDEFMDVMISPLVEIEGGIGIREKDSWFKKILKMLVNFTIFKGNHGQKKYFSFNIVDKYNEYKIAVVPEEICGIPAIGAFEAMTCGCALIGIDHHMYHDLGMIPGKHYISYDGTLDDLKKTVQYYQNQPRELENIARCGELFVREHFSKSQVANNFIESVVLS